MYYLPGTSSLPETAVYLTRVVVLLLTDGANSSDQLLAFTHSKNPTLIREPHRLPGRPVIPLSTHTATAGRLLLYNLLPTGSGLRAIALAS